MTVALSAGLYVSHVFIPPTPGPIAAAGSLGLGNNLLLVMGLGFIVSIPALLAAYIYAKYIGKRVKSSEDKVDSKILAKTYDELVKEYGKLPGGFMSIAPILIPVLLMAMGSVASVLKWEGFAMDIFSFLGNPLIALTAGLIFAIILLGICGKMNVFNSITNDTLKVVGPILFITDAGGVLGRVNSSAGFVEYMTKNASMLSGVGILFPFLIAAILKTAQGSSTVAIVTTAGIMGSFSEAGTMMAALGFTTPLAAALTVMAIGAGAMTVTHANDSYFWVVTNFGGMRPQDGYKSQTMVTLIMGIVSMVAIYIISLLA